MATASDVVRIAKSQIGECEYPANSNKQKYGKAYGWNGTFWCAQFVWWCGWMADEKRSLTIAKSASAAYIQDETVSKHGGKWIMKKNKSKASRKAGIQKAKPGDIVSFDFGAMDAVRDHVGLVVGIDGNYYICVEGNTSAKGSQSNGGMVCEQRRIYTSVCSIVRPKYGDSKPHTPTHYTGTYPKLPERGWFQRGDQGAQVKHLQRLLNWACDLDLEIDGDLGPVTSRAILTYQTMYKLTKDAEFGDQCLKKAKKIKK